MVTFSQLRDVDAGIYERQAEKWATIARRGEEEADLVARRFPLDEAVRMVLTGEIVNGATVCGLLAAHTIRTLPAPARPADAPWPDLPSRMADRRG